MINRVPPPTSLGEEMKRCFVWYIFLRFGPVRSGPAWADFVSARLSQVWLTFCGLYPALFDSVRPLCSFRGCLRCFGGAGGCDRCRGGRRPRGLQNNALIGRQCDLRALERRWDRPCTRSTWRQGGNLFDYIFPDQCMSFFNCCSFPFHMYLYLFSLLPVKCIFVFLGFFSFCFLFFLFIPISFSYWLQKCTQTI